jgi:hypothetical protein
MRPRRGAGPPRPGTARRIRYEPIPAGATSGGLGRPRTSRQLPINHLAPVSPGVGHRTAKRLPPERRPGGAPPLRLSTSGSLGRRPRVGHRSAKRLPPEGRRRRSSSADVRVPCHRRPRVRRQRCDDQSERDALLQATSNRCHGHRSHDLLLSGRGWSRGNHGRGRSRDPPRRRQRSAVARLGAFLERDGVPSLGQMTRFLDGVNGTLTHSAADRVPGGDAGTVASVVRPRHHEP